MLGGDRQTLILNGSEEDKNDGGRDNGGRDNGGRHNSSIPPRKSKVIWVPDLECAFLEAISHLGPDATPKRILKFMNVAGLTRENVASHLQKFRDKRKKAVKDPMISSSSVHNFQGIWADTEDLSVLNQPQFVNSSVNNNPYPNYAFNVQANTRGPRNPQISSLGPTNVVTGFYSPQNHSSSSGTFMPSSSNIAHHLSVNSNATNTNFWGTQMTGGAGNKLVSNKGFMSLIGYDSLVTSSSNFGERSSSGPYIVQEEQELPSGFPISEPLPRHVFPAANNTESPLFSPAPMTQPPVAMIEPRENAPIAMNSPDQQNYGYGYLQDVILNRPAKGVISSSPGTSMIGPSNKLQTFKISNLGHQLEDFAFLFEQGLGQDIQLNGLDNNAPENRSALPSNKSPNLQQGSNENSTDDFCTCIGRLFADEEPNTIISDDTMMKIALELKMLIG